MKETAKSVEEEREGLLYGLVTEGGEMSCYYMFTLTCVIMTRVTCIIK